MKNDKPTFHAFKKTESGEIFVQWRKGGKFVKVDAEVGAFVVFASIQKERGEKAHVIPEFLPKGSLRTQAEWA